MLRGGERRKAFLTKGSLACGIAVPFVYFGSQMLAAQASSGYDWHQQLASELGAGRRASADLFNTGMFIAGGATVLAAYGFLRVLRRTTPLWAWVVAACLVSSGGATLWAAAHPLPSVFHNPGLWGIGTLLFPAALAGAFARDGPAGGARFYLLLSFTAAAALLLLIHFSMLPAAPPGLLQRIAAACVYPPVAVGAYTLLRPRRRRLAESARS